MKQKITIKIFSTADLINQQRKSSREALTK